MAEVYVSAFPAGRDITLMVTVVGDDDKPADPGTLTARIRRPDGDVDTLLIGRFSRLAAGMYSATYQPTRTGRHDVGVATTVPSAAAATGFDAGTTAASSSSSGVIRRPGGST